MTNWITLVIELAIICFLYELWREYKKCKRQRIDDDPDHDKHNSHK